MSLFDDASLVLTPNGYKASKLYSIKPTSGLGDMTVVRATTATRVNSAGVIESVAINVPRLDYPPLGGCPSILVEPLRTNLVFPSATLTTQTRTVTAVAHTLSFYGTGTIVLSGVHIATLTGTGANDRVTLTFTPTAGSLILTVAGTVTNAQLEAGSNATSYIPTVAATATRNADVISKTGISSLIGQTEGTLYFEVQGFSDGNTVTQFITLNDGTTTNQIGFNYTQTLGRINGYFRVSGVSLSITSTVLKTLNSKIILKYNSSYVYTLFINGSLIGTVNALNPFSFPLTAFKASQGDGGFPYNGNIKSIVLYKTALTNAQCIALTT